MGRARRSKKLHVFDWDGRWILAKVARSAWDTAFQQLCDTLSSETFPLASFEVEARVREAVTEELSRNPHRAALQLSLHKLGCIAYGAGARLRGPFIVRVELPQKETQTFALPLPPGIPDEARAVFESLDDDRAVLEAVVAQLDRD